MSIKNYYTQLHKQNGLKAYIKKRIFNNLLKELVKEEEELEKLKETIKKQSNEWKKQEKIIRAVTQQPKETLLFRNKPGLLIDVTQVSATKIWATGVHRRENKIWMTGLQRVVNNIFHQIYNITEDVVPIQFKSGRLITSNLYLSRLEGLEERAEQTVMFQQGDSILFLDTPWNNYENFSHILDMAAHTGSKSFAIVHDLIPVQYPEVCEDEKVIREFIGWHTMILQKADAAICVSKTTADALAAYYEQMRFVRTRPLSIYSFHLGADVPEGTESVREEIRHFVSDSKFTFLMVGTVEARKGHITALQALQKFPDAVRRNCRLLIIGKNGWKNEDVRNMLDMPEFRDSVLWIRDASDEELRWSYAHTDALIAASIQEGFGLPLIEAAHFGLPVICSDIPIFREVTQGNADYFTVKDADSLSECLMNWMQAEQHPDSRKIPVYSWRESAREVLDIIEGKIEPYKILQ